MANLDVKLVKELRERTQAGFSDCQKALLENNNDIDKAILWLKEKGAVKAEKKAGAIAAEGLTNAIKNNKKAMIIEVNSETDFVAKNEDFKKLVNDIEKTVFDSGITEKEIVDELKLPNGKTIKEACIEATAKIGEKISFRRAEIIEFKNENVVIGTYSHHNGKFAVIVAIQGESTEKVANDIAMHVGALNPKFINSNSIDSKFLNQQKEEIKIKTIADFEERAKSSGKPYEPKHVEKTIEGRLKKIQAEICLEDQAFAKDPSISVKKYILNNGDAKLIYMQRFELGEGIEKKENNFAAEVAAQMSSK